MTVDLKGDRTRGSSVVQVKPFIYAVCQAPLSCFTVEPSLMYFGLL